MSIKRHLKRHLKVLARIAAIQALGAIVLAIGLAFIWLIQAVRSLFVISVQAISIETYDWLSQNMPTVVHVVGLVLVVVMYGMTYHAIVKEERVEEEIQEWRRSQLTN